MANQEHLDILKQGVDVWNAWRQANPVIVPDLREANLTMATLPRLNLTRAHLNEAHLDGATLSEAILSEATLTRAHLFEANLIGANLDGANLNGANLFRTNLSGASLKGARLTRADLILAQLTRADLSMSSLTITNLSRANLNGAELTGAVLGGTIFSDVDLRGISGLETVRHSAPSTIGIDTLYKSGNQIPEAFLRGCGVPDSFIDYIPSLVGALQPVQFYSCFISYSTKDDDFARRLHERMRAEHLRVWFAPEDIKGGEKLYDQIDRAIQLHDRLLIVLSEHSIHSEWVMTEIRRARRAEQRENRRKLFPIRLTSYDTLREWECFDADSGKDLAVEVREYFIPDFSQWKDHDAFEAAFARLLRDLKAAETA